ncbi:uncharacterized protein V6R79_018936 [Siganus canaliculatus]
MQGSVSVSVLGRRRSPAGRLGEDFVAEPAFATPGRLAPLRAPAAPGRSHSLIMINILLEAIHYRLPPKHLWFWTSDTSPSIPPRQTKGGE